MEAANAQKLQFLTGIIRRNRVKDDTMAHSVVHSVYREAVTVSEWTVRINGVDRVNVKPGDCVEIGRKPLRPLADDGMQRLDVVCSRARFRLDQWLLCGS